ncbi:beta-1,4-glucuronyltransferase 1 [Procambarus clarkii]|uniref:beta-1,4-glucuronyltransferase 1 n=1 Tax=Procambarus clarkii TaxID=6728 RepID=UPI0037429B61
MVQMLCKVWGVGMFSIVALTTSNILLTLRLMHGREEVGVGGGCGGVVIPDAVPHSWTSALSSTNHTEYLAFLRSAAINTDSAAGAENDEGAQDAGVVMGAGFVVDEVMGRWDGRRRYKTHDHVFTGPQYPKLSRVAPVCLATQSSVDRLFWLTQVARYWRAPMSVAVFTPDVEYAIARAYLTYLVACFPFLGEKVTFHFTYPREHLPKDLTLTIDHLEDKCDQPLSVLKGLLKQRSAKVSSNLDLGRGAGGVWSWCWRGLVVVLEGRGRSDELPPEILAVLQGKLNNHLGMQAMSHNNVAKRLTGVYRCRWEAREQEKPLEGRVSVSHDVTNFEFFYEPFYVARDDAPTHDERFLGYGFTRNTQVYEMHVSGYTFHVLSPIFTLHWGMQVKRTRPAWREKQNNANRRLFEGFKREVFARYGKDPLNMMATKKPRKA